MDGQVKELGRRKPGERQGLEASCQWHRQGIQGLPWTAQGSNQSLYLDVAKSFFILFSVQRHGHYSPRYTLHDDAI